MRKDKFQMSEHELTYRRLLPTSRVVVSVMACISFVSGVTAGYLFMTSLAGVSQAVKIVWTTGSAAYALVSLLLIIGVWKVIRWLVYPYMCMLLMAIAVYTMILQSLFKNLPAAVFTSVAISFIFLGIALHTTKTMEENRRNAAT
ncbi:uncharacterized protein LOC119551358 [Drosophila subpulchrella]|uniref:uncharacterized protein LOC119551358 n=1 Tax=Drosophila subpulchrella TaxID=1486046 RepID=UPI0018A15CA0|nr:uncharacterized protein LOC119551358 [Drosophila subpulchrella]